MAKEKKESVAATEVSSEAQPSKYVILPESIATDKNLRQSVRFLDGVTAEELNKYDKEGVLVGAKESGDKFSAWIKVLSLALVLLFGLSQASFADIGDEATIGNKNSSGEYRVRVKNDGTFQFASDTPIKYPYETYTSANTANTLTALESGKTLTDCSNLACTGSTGTAGCSKHTLPTAAVGLEFTFVAGNQCSMTVDTADTNDTILYSITGTKLDAGDSIKSTGQAGDSVTLTSTVANKWSITQMKGVWTDNGAS